MSRNRWIQILFLLITLGCLLGAASLVPSINRKRLELQLNPETKIGESIPPHMAIATAALGPFRGLLIDVFWHRATRLQAAGKYYESNTLAHWITTLQPRFPAVWVFQAWNMAYNISVATNTQEERWDWVNKGIRLLRDEGIIYNPRNVYLFREIAWIFWHKIADTADDAHWYYKRRLADEWQQIMGSPNVGATAKEVIDAFRPIVAAPDTIEALIAERPDARLLLDELAELGFQPDDHLLRYLGRLAMINFNPQPVFTDWPVLVRFANMNPRLIVILEDHERADLLMALLAFMRRRVLIDKYHMEPDRMLLTMETYGPLDWRHACAHALYWAMAGVNLSDLVRDRDFQTKTQYGNTHRLNVMALQRLLKEGQLTYDVATNYFGLQPDPRFEDYYDVAVERAIKSLEGNPQMKTVADSYKYGHENYLLNLVYFRYIWGDQEKAREIFDKSAGLYRDMQQNKKNSPYKKTLDDFVLGYLKQNRDTMVNTRQFIDAMIRRGIKDGLATGETERWDYAWNLAERMHAEFQKEGVTTTITADNRNMLPPFPQVVAEVYHNFMQSPESHPLLKRRVWINSPLELRVATYQQLRVPLSRHCRLFNLDFKLTFPAPRGLALPEDQPQPPQPAQPQQPPKPEGVEVERF